MPPLRDLVCPNDQNLSQAASDCRHRKPQRKLVGVIGVGSNVVLGSMLVAFIVGLWVRCKKATAREKHQQTVTEA